MKLMVIGSGSSGNGYLLTDGIETLVIESGKRLLDVKKALNFQIRGIVGAIDTHTHGDHHKYASEYELAGIPVWTPWKDDNLRQVKTFGGFTVKSFECIHDVPCVGYLIEHHDSGLKMLYATDTEYVRYTFKGLTAMLIEMNHSDEYIDKNSAKYSHVKQGHLEKQTTIDCIRANMNEKMRNIILCHLSRDADPTEFMESVQNIVSETVKVDVAKRNLIVDLV